MWERVECDDVMAEARCGRNWSVMRLWSRPGCGREWSVA